MRLRSWLMPIMMVSCAFAHEKKSYQTGDVVAVMERRTDLGFGPFHASFLAEIRTVESTYFVTLSERPEKLGWAIGSTIHFRVNKSWVFGVRSDGRAATAIGQHNLE